MRMMPVHDPRRRLSAPAARLLLIVCCIAGTGARADEATEAPAADDEPQALTLTKAIELALANNYALLAGAERVAAGAAEVTLARAGLRPEVALRAGATQIDEDRAAAGTGRMPERRITGALTLTQVIYSDDARAQHRVARQLQQARESDQAALALDTVLQSATRFLELLRAQRLLRIERQNLGLTESNRKRAEVRLELGVANRSEIYRWETAQANQRANLAAAEAQVRQAWVGLNRSLNLPLSERYPTAAPTLNDPYFLFAASDLRATLEDPEARPAWRRYFVAEMVRHAPELEAARQRIAANLSQLKPAARRRYVPEVSFSAGIEQEFNRSGAGTRKLDVDLADVFPGVAPGSRIGGDTDDTEWQLGIEARLPLYQGGALGADEQRLRAELDASRLSYDDRLQQLHAQTLQQAYVTEAGFDRIAHTRTAAEASRRNLELVTDAYARGVVAVIDLIDAQVEAFRAEQTAANAVFDFLLEYMRLQRLAGRFDVTTTDDRREAMRERLQRALGEAR